MPRLSAAALQRSLAEGRRRARRYEIRLTLRFAALRHGEAPITGSGESLNISCSGMLFRSDKRLMAGDSLVVLVDWPVAAPDNEPLKLVVTGTAVRARRGEVGMAIHTHRLLRERDIEKRLSVFWASAETNARPRRGTQDPTALIEDDDEVAVLVSGVLSPEGWNIERADVSKAKSLLSYGASGISLLVTRTPELLNMLKPEIPAILTLSENVSDAETGPIADQPLRIAVRRPLTDVGLRSLIRLLCGLPERTAQSGAGQFWTH